METRINYTFASQFKKRELLNGAIAQLVEQRTENPCVPGSIPGGTTSKWSYSSVGSEHLPYKQRVLGSNPSETTKEEKQNNLSKQKFNWSYSSVGSEHLPYKQRVLGSNPSETTQTRDASNCVSFFISLCSNIL